MVAGYTLSAVDQYSTSIRPHAIKTRKHRKRTFRFPRLTTFLVSGATVSALIFILLLLRKKNTPPTVLVPFPPQPAPSPTILPPVLFPPSPTVVQMSPPPPAPVSSSPVQLSPPPVQLSPPLVQLSPPPSQLLPPPSQLSPPPAQLSPPPLTSTTPAGPLSAFGIPYHPPPFPASELTVFQAPPPNPPMMGWRSWQFFNRYITQAVMIANMNQLVNTSLPGMGGTSLFDLGYTDAGLDDGFQLCNATPTTLANPYRFHAPDGSINIDTSKFPDMKAMVDHGHALGLTVGWYLCNCICQENSIYFPPGASYLPGGFIIAEMAQFNAFGFDNLKVDGCAEQVTGSSYGRVALHAPYHLNFMKHGSSIENCFNGGGPYEGFNPGSLGFYPETMFRASGDVVETWTDIFREINGLLFNAIYNISRPGLWAYGDMLVTGNDLYNTGAAFPHTESRTQFGAYCILSSPLVLGTNLLDDAALKRMLPIVTNTDAITINQVYFGFSGGNYSTNGDALFLYKPLSWTNSTVAVMVINTGTGVLSGSFVFADIPYFFATSSVAVRDVWAQQDLGAFSTSYPFSGLASHDTVFLRLLKM